MLQARKKIQKKELKKDPFFEKIDQGVRLYNRFKNFIYIAAAAVIVLIAAYYMMSANAAKRENASAADFGIAQQYIDAGDYESAEARLQQLISGNTGKKYEGLATYYMGYISMLKQDYDQASFYFEDYLNNYHTQALYNGAAMEGIANIEKGQGNYVKAAEYYIKAAAYSDSFRKDYSLMKDAFGCYMTAGSAEKAEKVLRDMELNEDISKEYSSDIRDMKTLL